MISQDWILWLGAVSLAMFLVSLATLPWLVSLIPEDYFCHRHREPTLWKYRHPALRAAFLVAKNLLGWILVVGGLIMLFIPGQGLLTILMGFVLMDYPGKYALERRVVSYRAIHSGLNWLRARRGAPPLRVDP